MYYIQLTQHAISMMHDALMQSAEGKARGKGNDRPNAQRATVVNCRCSPLTA